MLCDVDRGSVLLLRLVGGGAACEKRKGTAGRCLFLAMHACSKLDANHPERKRLERIIAVGGKGCAHVFTCLLYTSDAADE